MHVVMLYILKANQRKRYPDPLHPKFLFPNKSVIPL